MSNVELLIREENPLTLKYLYFAMHDINLVHMLATLGYFSEDASGAWNNVIGVDFNSSIRFEVYETVMYASDALDFLP